MQPSNNNGSLIIRFRLNGYNYSLRKLGKYDNPKDFSLATHICLAIKSDMAIGRFYPKDNNELFDAYHPLAKQVRNDSLGIGKDCLQLVEAKLSSLSMRDRNLYQTANFLRRYDKPIRNKEQALKFWQWLQLTSKGNSKTINRHLESLKPICGYFADIPKLKTTQAKGEKPFTKEEIKKIIDIFDKNFTHYGVFIRFLFATGCRPSEAIALKFDSIDWDNSTVTISEAMATAKDGSKQIKGTKTGVTRIIPLTLNLKTLLAVEYEIYSKKGYTHNRVFTSSNGSYIDLGNLRARAWIKALELAQVPYRTIYNTRHTFCSHFLNETPDFIKLASITHGTKSGVQTLIKHYAHLVSDISMPELF